MKKSIFSRNVQSSGKLREYAQSKIVQPLEKLGKHIRSVKVGFKDPSKHRNDPSKQATAIVTLASGKVLNMSSRGADFYVAVDDLSRRVKHAVKSHIGRLRDR